MARAEVAEENVSEANRSARKRIVAAARTLFFANGFRGLTMDDLAAELGMSKKTLYAHFESKHELLKAVILNKIEDSEAAFDSLAEENPPDFSQQLQQLLACVGRVAQEIQPPFIRDLQRDAPELFTLIQSRRSAVIHRHFKRLIEQGRHAGIVRKDIPTTLIIEILLGATEAIVNPTRMVQLRLSPQFAYSTILRVVLEGVIVRREGGLA
jgi:AcrR family transcriptional regulator